MALNQQASPGDNDNHGRKPRIVISTQNFPPERGGIQSYMYFLANELHAMGYPLTVFTDAPSVPDEEKFDAQSPYPIHRAGGLKFIRRYRKAGQVKSFLKQLATPAIVICDSWKSLELLAERDCELHTVLCIGHGMEFPIGGPQNKAARIKSVLNKAKYVLANSNYTRSRIAPYVDDLARIKILHPGVAIPVAAASQDLDTVQARLSRFSNSVITVGRLEDRKGQDKIIQALPKLLGSHPQLGYVIVGDGPSRKRLEAQVTQLGLENSVLFTGGISDSQKSAYLQAADIFAMPTRAVGNSAEGFGIVYLEAALFAKPCIAGKIGGAEDAVLDQVTGIVCDGDSLGEIETAIKFLLDHPETMRKYGEQARARALAEFLWPEIVRQLTHYF